MPIETILQILVPTLLALAALITSLANRKLPKNDEKRVTNESFTAQIDASKSLADTSKELVQISQTLLNRLEEELAQVVVKNNQLEAAIEEIRHQANECKASISALQSENSRIMQLSKQLLEGVQLLLAQMRAIDIKPIWTPPQELLDTMDRRFNRIDNK